MNMTGKPTILIVEDDDAIRENLAEMVELNGFHVIVAENGLDGFAVAKRELPALVLTDVGLPGMTGFELLEAFNRDEDLREIPVIVITARMDRASTRRGMDLGAQDYITKPFEEEEVLRSITTRLERSAPGADKPLSREEFRDLFHHEALMPGRDIKIGTVTVAFTDLRGSTKMYHELGDTPALDRVLGYFEILRSCIVAEQGLVTKTIGDAVMAIFRHPAAALRALSKAQQQLKAEHGLDLRAGVHVGQCLSVKIESRLDYFGSSVNFAARLEAEARDNDFVISEAVRKDPEVEALLSSGVFLSEPFRATLRGFGETVFDLSRVTLAAPASLPAGSIDAACPVPLPETQNQAPVF